MNQKKYIACTINEAYAPHFGVMCTSLFVNHPEEEFEIFLIYDTLKKSDEKKINQLFEKHKQYIHYLPFHTDLVKEFPLSAHAHFANYYRLFLTDLLPSYIEQVLYLDCDIIVDGNITVIWQTALGNYWLAAVQDIGITTHQDRLPMQSARYFNSGVMFINLDKWRKEKVVNRFTNFIDTFEGKLSCWDQDVLNVVFDGQWKALPIPMNVQTYVYDFSLETIADFTQQEAILKAKVQPTIIHYTTPFKPWSIHSTHPMKHKYYSYKKKSPWKKTYLQYALEKLLSYVKRTFIPLRTQ
ncbi:MAG: glycosyltransferase family 8 protein [Bacteroidota bacterium]